MTENEKKMAKQIETMNKTIDGMKKRIRELKDERNKYQKVINELRYIKLGIPVGRNAYKFRFENNFISRHDYDIAIRYLNDREKTINDLLALLEENK